MMTWISSFVKFGNALFILPIVLLQFSEAEVSVWLLFNLIISLSLVADSGFGPTMIRAASYFYSGVDKVPHNIEQFKLRDPKTTGTNFNGLMILLNTYSSTYILLGFFSLIFLLTVGQFIVSNAINMVNPGNQLNIAYNVLVVRSLFWIQYIKWSSFIQGIDKVTDIKKAEAISETGKIIAMFIILLLGGRILELMLVDLLFSILIYFYSKYYVKKWFNRQGHNFISKLKFNGPLFKTLWPANWRFAGMQYGSFLTTNGTSVLVSQLNNPSLIASYLLTHKLILFIRQVSQTPLYANLPKIFQLMAKKNYKYLKSFCARNIVLGMGIQLTLLIGLLSFSEPIMSFFDIKTSLAPSSVMIIMALSIMLELHHGFHAQIYMGSNHVPFLLPGIVSGIFILGIGYNVISVYGLIGLVLTQFLVQLSFNNWYPVYLNLKLLNWEFGDYMKALLLK
jgi:hypothetical protein